MKKVVLIVAALFAALSLSAQDLSITTSREFVQVTGYAEKEVTPDEIWVKIVINEKDSKGKISVEAQEKDLYKIVSGMGLDPKTTLFVENETSSFLKKSQAVSMKSFLLKLSTASQVSEAFSSLEAAGISNLSVFKITHSKLRDFESEVRAEAIRNAQANARVLAEAIGQSIGWAFEINDYGRITARTNNAVYMAKSAAVTMEAAADGVMEEAMDLNFKSLKLECSLNAKFVLNRK